MNVDESSEYGAVTQNMKFVTVLAIVMILAKDVSR